MDLNEYLTRRRTASSATESPRCPRPPTPTRSKTARIAVLGDRQGRVKALQEALQGDLQDDKPAAGKRFNEARTRLEALHAERKTSLDRARDGARPPTISRCRRGASGAAPSIRSRSSSRRSRRSSASSDSRSLKAPKPRSEWYNFGALNFPPNHPALDAHDTLYLEGEARLLRTHTSPVQVRTLQQYAPPIRVLIPGMVYRRDFFDASHAPAFAQIEGLCVDEGISFVDLKSTLNHFAERFFGASRTRFRPSYFPFTEPSAEMDVQCGICGGVGCAALQGHGLDRDPRLRHGASGGARGGRRRQRAVHGLGVRHGAGAHRHQPIWHS